MLVGLSKFLLGFTLAVAILFGAGVVFTNFVIGRLSSLPARPTFPNDIQPKSSPTQAPKPADGTAKAPDPAAATSPTIGYAAKVTQPIGLLVREAPSADSTQVDGVAVDEEVRVLETSSDGEWQRIKTGTGIEGWVKSGNTEKLN
ncbi:MAG: SH3 domain-containing protein [Leptolyngbyaceae cyanobacterium CSU_1_4]|nr:SH3 domain-containing protein [Leptolyngbyaceae cyanobacterium CSU_1_4]